MARHTDNWISTYLEYTKASESPDAFHFWTAVSTVAGALKGKVWIDQRHFVWRPNFYIILVGPPGIAAKSTSVKSGMKLLENTPKMHFGPQSGTWQALGESFMDSIETYKYINSDGEEISEVMSAITIAASELGTFLNVDDKKFMDVMIDLWDGDVSTWRHKTKSSGDIEIKNPWCNLIGCTTPSWLRANFTEEMIGGGLSSRIIFVYREKKRHFVAYPSRLVNEENHKKLHQALQEDLMSISTMTGQYRLTDAAMDWGEIWYRDHWESRKKGMESERYGGYLARKQTHIHKMAMVIAASRSSRLIIDTDILVEADLLISQIEGDMQKVFQTVGGSSQANQIDELVTYIRAHNGLGSRELWSMCYNIMDYKTFKEALQAAAEADMVYFVNEGGRAMVKPKYKNS